MVGWRTKIQREAVSIKVLTFSSEDWSCISPPVGVLQAGVYVLVSACVRRTVCGAPSSPIQPPIWLSVLNANFLSICLKRGPLPKDALRLILSSLSALIGSVSLWNCISEALYAVGTFSNVCLCLLFCHRHIILQVPLLFIQPLFPILSSAFSASRFPAVPLSVFQLSPPLLTSLSLSPPAPNLHAYLICPDAVWIVCPTRLMLASPHPELTANHIIIKFDVFVCCSFAQLHRWTSQTWLLNTTVSGKYLWFL